MHQSVLLRETVELLSVRADGVYVDGTLGSGGHSEAILKSLGPGGRLLGLDRDADALKRTAARLSPFEDQFTLVQANYADVVDVARQRGIDQLDGAVLDLGVSSNQLDEPGRGFSFQGDGPLDMRMDVRQSLSAADVVNGWPESELADVIRRYGEEPRARRIAAAIVKARAQAPLETTAQLAGIVEQAVGGRRGKRHPATQTFQALRMVVNDELGSLERGLDGLLGLLANGGRMAVIAFHSLEDRLVKQFFRAHAGRWESLQAGGARWVGQDPPVKLVTRKPVVPGEAELARNPRSRSARLRVAERIAECERDRKQKYKESRSHSVGVEGG